MEEAGVNELVEQKTVETKNGRKKCKGGSEEKIGIRMILLGVQGRLTYFIRRASKKGVFSEDVLGKIEMAQGG